MIKLFRPAAAAFRRAPRLGFKIPPKTLSFVFFMTIYPQFKANFSASSSKSYQNEKSPEISKLHELLKKENDEILKSLKKGIDFFDSGKLVNSFQEFATALHLSDMRDGPISHGACLACYYLGEIHRVNGDLNRAITCYERTVECVLFAKDSKTDVNNKFLYFSSEELQSIYQKLTKSIVELEKKTMKVSPLSSFIRKTSLIEEFNTIQKNLPKYENNPAELAISYSHVANILLIQKMKNAAEMKLKGLEYMEKFSGNQREIMIPVYIEMGQFFAKLNSLKLAEEYFLKALQLTETLAEKLGKEIRTIAEFEVNYMGLAKVYSETREFEKGVNCMKKTIYLMENSLKETTRPSEKFSIYYETGLFLKQLNRDKETLGYLEKAGKIAEEYSDNNLTRGMAGPLFKEIGELYEKRQDFEGAKKAYEKSLEFCAKIFGEENPLTKAVREQLEKVRTHTKKGWFFN